MIGARELARRIGLDPPTDEQAAVVESALGAAVVIAGAGSGKTATMATRVVWLVANGLVAADGVLGLTFTRKASAELGARIRHRLRAWAEHEIPVRRAALLVAEPTVLTYAAYCGRLVADHGLRLGVEPTTRLISPAVAWQLADSAVRRHTGDLPEDVGTPPSVTGYVLKLAGELADHLQEPADVIAFTDRVMAYIDSLPAGGRGNAYPGELAKLVSSLAHRAEILPLVADFRRRKRIAGAVDFSDQMVWAARLAQLPEVRAIERERYPAVLLDEYQDTGHAQITLLKALFADGHPITAVGDPFQSIYSWRGASAGNIGRFAEDFSAGARLAAYPLSTSWRNDGAILGAANRVAAELRAGHPGTRTLRPRDRAESGLVRTACLRTVEDEAAWVADELAAAWAEASRAAPGVARTAAVLVRRRSQIPLLDEALRAVGLPVEIVGLGGLLITAEVGDVVATLRVLADYTSGAALLRLLTGARWRIGPRDLVALARRARELARPPGGQTGPPAAAARPQRDPGSIVEALDDLGDRNRYSAAGYRRMATLADELSRLRRRLSAPLLELVAEVERTIGVDIEVAARADRRAVGRVHLDRFLDAAADFSTDADEATLGAFLAFLTAAEKEENGLEAGEVEVEAERIQLLTVHGAKGLEWDMVAVPGLVEGVFPSSSKENDWTRSRHLLPFPLRGDALDLPALDVFGATTRRELAGWIKASATSDPSDDHDSRVRARHLLDERRLAYVALTRARHRLYACGFVWGPTKNPRAPSIFLTELAELTEPTDGADRADWYEVKPGETNPHDDVPVGSPWPLDPLGGRRAAVQTGADLVRAALAAGRADEPEPEPEPEPGLVEPELVEPELVDPELVDPGLTERQLAESWRRDIPTLLAERSARNPGLVREVALPARLSVSQLVALRQDPAALARRLHRPLPAQPAPLARRGTAFHLWLEQRWGGEALLDLDELPGAGDETALEDDDLLALRAAFLASEWAERVPVEVEVPFEMVFDGVVVRGRMDAVFADPAADPERPPGWLVVDWKTGAVPTGAPARAAAVQLAAYRVAWHGIVDTAQRPVPLSAVRAAFHYLRADRTVAPADLLDAEGLRALIAGAATSPRTS